MDSRGALPNPGQAVPMEIRDGVRQSRVLVVQVPPQYPDLSLAWIVARDLLLFQIGEKQVIPFVIEGQALRRPKHGIRDLVDSDVLSYENAPETQLVFIIDAFNFESRTRTAFLRQQIDSFPNAKFVVVTRDQPNVLLESQFAGKTAALLAYVCDVSFIEISYFLQKNFSLGGPEAEVIAAHLRDTFKRFNLPVHPTYFAGIPASTLNALLRANRRAELIELAVAGYLSYVVSLDDEPVSLSRTTREPALTISLTHSRARGADGGGRRRRNASYGVARDSHPVSTIR